MCLHDSSAPCCHYPPVDRKRDRDMRGEIGDTPQHCSWSFHARYSPTVIWISSLIPCMVMCAFYQVNHLPGPMLLKKKSTLNLLNSHSVMLAIYFILGSLSFWGIGHFYLVSHMCIALIVLSHCASVNVHRFCSDNLPLISDIIYAFFVFVLFACRGKGLSVSLIYLTN